MLEIYCRAQHGPGRELCAECAQLAAYANRRIDRCPYGRDKPACVNCPIHCYRTEPRERMRDVMRFAGPRMLTRHPVLALLHILVDARRNAPGRPARPTAAPIVEHPSR